jgi:hypothetical protein
MPRRFALGYVGLVAGLGSCGAWGCARKAPAVSCAVTYGGQTRRLDFGATKTPYAVQAIDIAGRFRFKAIYIREPWRAASVSTYAYHQAEAGDVLLQEGKYAPPFSLGAGARYGFTGRQLVYSPDQRELEYWCELSP